MRVQHYEWSHNPIFRNDHDNPARSSPSFSPGSIQTRSQLNWNEYLAGALWRWDVSARELRFNWPLNPGWQVKSDCKVFYWLFLWPFCAIQFLKRCVLLKNKLAFLLEFKDNPAEKQKVQTNFSVVNSCSPSWINSKFVIKGTEPHLDNNSI